MSIDDTGPVAFSEVTAVVDLLRFLASRARENKQKTLHMVLAMGAESLADNLEMVEGFDDV